MEQSLWNKEVVAPKTKSRRDSIWFDDILKQVLSEHRARSLHTGREDFAFSKADGSQFSPDVLRRDVLYPALDRLRIPRQKALPVFTPFGTQLEASSRSELGV